MSYAAWSLVHSAYPLLYIHRLRLRDAEKEAARLAKEADKEEQAVRRCGSSDYAGSPRPPALQHYFFASIIRVPSVHSFIFTGRLQ